MIVTSPSTPAPWHKGACIPRKAPFVVHLMMGLELSSPLHPNLSRRPACSLICGPTSNSTSSFSYLHLIHHLPVLHAEHQLLSGFLLSFCSANTMGSLDICIHPFQKSKLFCKSKNKSIYHNSSHLASLWQASINQSIIINCTIHRPLRPRLQLIQWPPLITILYQSLLSD